MQDEEMALNQTSGEETVVDTTPVVEEQTAEETLDESSEPASTEETETVETDQEEPKKGAEKRIRELSGKVKSLQQRLAEASLGNGGIPAQQYAPQVELDGEVTPEQYRQHILQEADAIVQLRIKAAEAESRVNSESSEVMRKYPQLDPESPSFDKELSETITEAIEAKLKVNPYSTSVKETADKLMKPFLRAVNNKVEQEKETITKQVSETALRPTNVRRQEKSLDEMTVDELRSRLEYVQA